MKLFLIAAFSIVSLSSSAQKKELNDVKFALEVFRLALLSGDRAQLMQITTPELSYAHSSCVIENQHEFV